MEDITGAVVTEQAKLADPASVRLLEETGEWLGLGLANLAAALDPGLFVIGGGLCEAGDLLLRPARHALERNLTGRGFRPLADVRLAALGPEGRDDRCRRPRPGRRRLIPAQRSRRRSRQTRAPSSCPSRSFGSRKSR